MQRSVGGILLIYGGILGLYWNGIYTILSEDKHKNNNRRSQCAYLLSSLDDSWPNCAAVNTSESKTLVLENCSECDVTYKLFYIVNKEPPARHSSKGDDTLKFCLVFVILFLLSSSLDGRWSQASCYSSLGMSMPSFLSSRGFSSAFPLLVEFYRIVHMLSVRFFIVFNGVAKWAHVDMFSFALVGHTCLGCSFLRIPFLGDHATILLVPEALL